MELFYPEFEVVAEFEPDDVELIDIFFEPEFELEFIPEALVEDDKLFL